MTGSQTEGDASKFPTVVEPNSTGVRGNNSTENGTLASPSASKRSVTEEKEEVDEFGLPIPKILVSSRPSSTRSDSFQSAHSSIHDDDDQQEKFASREDEDAADVEDNDIEDSADQLSPAIEWPRISRSTLPATGHVKSSPFHAAPPKPTGTSRLYAERAKDLIKVAPVSNSIFKRQESPVAESPLPRSPSTISITSPKSVKSSPSTPEKPPPTVKSQSPASIVITPAATAPENVASEVDDNKKPQVTISTDVPEHTRNLSTGSAEPKSANVIFEDPKETAYNPSGASEWSHQLAVTQTEDRGSPGKTRKSLENDGWQTMEAFATYDIYDDNGKLIAKQFDEYDDDESVHGGASKGYTRMNQADDIQSADSMDENTQYLFKESLDDSDATTPLSQMQATKELLTEGQRIAYVGLCKLTLVGMLRDVGRVRFKENRAAYESMTLWSQKMMIRLFSHMDISPAEQVMIEQLAEHGVIPDDLIPSLTINIEVANPLTTSSSSSDIASLASVRSDQSSPPPSYSSTPLSPSSPPPVQDPSTLTSKRLALDLRWTVLCDLFLVLIADSVYDARSRVLLERMGAHLGVEWLDITRFERRVTEALQIQEASEQNWKEDTLIEARAKQARNRRYMMMGLATLGGGLVIGLSAGLLAPVIGAGLGAAFTTVGIGGTTGFLAGTGGAALITTGGVVTGSSIAGRGMAKRTRNVSTFEFRPLHNNQRVNLLVTVSGWMSSKEDDVRLPFSTLDPVMGDVISLYWEPETLQSMGQTMNLLATEILTQSLQQVLGQTVLVALMSSIQWPVMLTKLSYLIDNPWSTSLDRASACGLLLADCLMNKHLGQRPISLAGYSLGARVIYYCLLELARCKAFGLVQDVFFFGAPVIIKQKECLRAQSVVAGRFVNGYKKNDWILGYLFRATSTGLGRVAGLRPIENCGDIENLDCTDLVGGHLLYRDAIPKLMKEAGFLVVSEEFSEMEDPDPDKHRERQIQLYDEIEEAKRLVAQEEDEAIKTGKKIKKRSRKSGFLGLWGKEIDTKPADYDPAKHAAGQVKQSDDRGEYDPYSAKASMQSNGDVKSDTGKSTPTMSFDEKHSGVLFDADKMSEDSAMNGKATTKGKSTDAKIDTTLFDVEAMRQELAVNGITMTSLESTLPPLVLSSPPAAPPMHRASTTPYKAPIHRIHSPSLPTMSHNNMSTGNIQSTIDITPRDVTPKRELDKLVIDTKKASVGWNLPPPENEWDHETEREITMTFAPDSPELPRTPARKETVLNEPYSTSPKRLEEWTEYKPKPPLSTLDLERNVWDDDEYGSGGNITMSFE